MIRLVKNLRGSIGATKQHGWVLQSRQTKDKLNNFIVKIGYPDKWRITADLEKRQAVALRKHAEQKQVLLELNRR